MAKEGTSLRYPLSVTVLIIVAAIVRVAVVKGRDNQLRNASIDWLYLWSNIEIGSW